MGARSKRPPRARRDERAGKLHADAGRVSAAKVSEARTKPSKAEQRAERASLRAEAIERNASSIPPAALHAVFEVAVPAPGRMPGSSLPPPLPSRKKRGRLSALFAKRPPPPPRPRVQAAADEGEELSETEYEFASDALGIPPLTAPRTDAPIELPSPRRPAPMPYRTIAMVSASLIVLVFVLGARGRAGAPAASAPAAAQRAAPAAASPRATDTPARELTPVAVAAQPSAADAPSVAATGSPSASPAVDNVPTPAPAGDAVVTASSATALGRAVAAASAGVVRTPISDPNAPPFDAPAASSAISAAFARAARCRKDGDPSGVATILLTYAPSGRVTSAVLSGPFSGTTIGGCIASTLRTARVPAFSGEYITVKRTQALE